MNDSIREEINNIEKILQKYLPEKKGYQKTIFEAMEYSLMAGGKRLRPLFMLEVYKMCGGKDASVVEPFMVALEMIHTYSLIHDDLPAMDNDEYRRGKKTAHVEFGEAMAILSGDALLNYAYETAALAVTESKNISTAARAMKILTTKAGVYGMVGGQVVDVEMNGCFLDEKMLDFIYRLKTAALLEAAFMIGGVLAGVSGEQIDMLEQIARNVGIAFQIQDDILDVTSTTQVLGKPVNSDEKNEKSTYVAFKGLEAVHAAVEDYSNKAINLLDTMSTSNEKTVVKQLIHDLINRNR